MANLQESFGAALQLHQVLRYFMNLISSSFDEIAQTLQADERALDFESRLRLAALRDVFHTIQQQLEALGSK